MKDINKYFLLKNDLENLKYYQNKSKDYTEKYFNFDLNHLRNKFITLLKDKDLILDLGCGHCRDAIYFQNSGIPIVGFDLSINLLLEGFNRGFKNSIMGNMRFLPFKKDVFSGIWACASLVHIPHNSLPAVIKEIKRVLKIKGILFLSVKEGDNRVFIEEDDKYKRIFYLYNADFLREILEINSFKIIEIIRENSSTFKFYWLNVFAELTNY